MGSAVTIIKDAKIVSPSIDAINVVDISPSIDISQQKNLLENQDVYNSGQDVDYSQIKNTKNKIANTDIVAKTLTWDQVKDFKSSTYIKDKAGWALFDKFAEFANLKVRGGTLSTTMTLGNDTTLEPGVLTLKYYPAKGDTKIQAGKEDYGDPTNGFIMGYDDDDGGKVKFELGDAMYYFKWTGSSLDIKTDSAIIGGASEFYGKLASTVVQQTNTDEKLSLRILKGAYEEDIRRADGEVVDSVISLPGNRESLLLTDFPLYGKQLGADIIFEFEYSMSTAETSHQVRLDIEYNVIDNSESVKPTTFTGTISEEFTVNNTADTKGRIIGTTLRIPSSDLSNNTELVQVRIKRIVTGLSGTNHGGNIRLHRARIYQEVI